MKGPDAERHRLLENGRSTELLLRTMLTNFSKRNEGKEGRERQRPWEKREEWGGEGV